MTQESRSSIMTSDETVRRVYPAGSARCRAIGVLCGSVDVQADRLEVLVNGYSKDRNLGAGVSNSLRQTRNPGNCGRN